MTDELHSLPTPAGYYWTPSEAAQKLGWQRRGTWSLNCGPHPDWDVTPYFTADQMHAFRAEGAAAERAHHSGWSALVMCAAAALEDAANCLRDPDAKRAALGAAAHYRTAALVNGTAP